ncbi:M48 family metalloprotease [Nonomuraea sp. NPDC051191]|uniref:M48 family metalloprotease n=1 Tax=Nonomuraea sp. NPDC051191 TaxID=3364372 RepID=UPI0037B9B459
MSERNDPPREGDEPAGAVARGADEPGTAVAAGHGGGVAIRDDEDGRPGDGGPPEPSGTTEPPESPGHPDDPDDPDTSGPTPGERPDADADPDTEDPRHLHPPTPDERPHAKDAENPAENSAESADAPGKPGKGRGDGKGGKGGKRGKGGKGGKDGAGRPGDPSDSTTTPEDAPDDADPRPGPGDLVGTAEHLIARERQRAESRSRRAAGIALALVGGVILAVAAFTTPWRVLAAGAPAVTPDPARDFSAAQIARAQAFDAATSLPGYISLGITVLFAGLLVLTPFAAKVLGVLRGPWWVRVVLGVVVLTAITEVLRWPLGMWFETILRDYGLSTQDWAGWTVDRLKNTGVGVVLLSVMLLALVALARKVRRWWIPAAVGAFALTLGVSYVYPVVFEPLFNDFTSMPPGSLRSDLLAMAERDGVPVKDVLVADASRRTTALNAYVSGFGATRRIVVYDTLLKAPESEVELVVAHELGHAKHADVLDGTLLGGLLAGWGTIVLFLLVGPLRRRTGIASVADPRAIGVLMGLMTLGSMVTDPAQNLITRHVEARADVHALDLTRDPATFVAMQKRLAITNISDLSPDAVEYVLYASHPSTPERIALARSWAKLNGVPEP